MKYKITYHYAQFAPNTTGVGETVKACWEALKIQTRKELERSKKDGSPAGERNAQMSLDVLEGEKNPIADRLYQLIPLHFGVVIETINKPHAKVFKEDGQVTAII